MGEGKESRRCAACFLRGMGMNGLGRGDVCVGYGWLMSYNLWLMFEGSLEGCEEEYI